MLKISQLKRVLEFEKHFGNPSDFEKARDNNHGKPNLPGTRAARILEAQKELDESINQKDSVPSQEK